MRIVIKNGETWLFCGGRAFADQSFFDAAISDIIGMYGVPEKVIHGDAPGLDQMAAAWGRRMAIDMVACPADWDKHGKAAGAIRNEDMLMKHKPKKVIAFPGGPGTADMVRRAKNRRGEIDVIEIVDCKTLQRMER